jgi:hypothetical protein
LQFQSHKSSQFYSEWRTKTFTKVRPIGEFISGDEMLLLTARTRITVDIKDVTPEGNFSVNTGMTAHATPSSLAAGSNPRHASRA